MVAGNAVVVDSFVKVAVTVVETLLTKTHEDVPAHPPPLHPLKVDPVAAVAARVTTLPAAYVAEHTVPQLMPTGVPTTVPMPVPVLLIVRVVPGDPHASFE